MESLCPNCQKLITVPEQYAGQQMKCPLCQQTFQAPSLAGSSAAAPFTPSAPPADVYKFTPEPSPPMSPAAAAAPSRRFEPSKPKAGDTTPPPPPPPPPAGYGRKFTIQLSPSVLPWIPAGCFFLIFVLTFFSWVGMYPGGIGVVTQNAWQVMYGGYSLDAAFDEMSKFEDAKDAPGFSVIGLFYLLTLVPILLVTIIVVVASVAPIKVPPAIQPLWAWRFLAVAVLSLIPLFFMLLQSLAGFPLEEKARAKVDQIYKDELKAAGPNEIKIRKVEIEKGATIGALSLTRTRARGFVILFHLIATVGALLAFWLERRGPNRPVPRFEMLW